MLFACGMGLRLARFNSMIEVEKPSWQTNYFTGMPAPAGAITVLLPLYIDGLGFIFVDFPRLSPSTRWSWPPCSSRPYRPFR